MILKWIVVSIKPQLYVGGAAPGTHSIKKPLNSFLGELFLGTWSDGSATAHLVAEQVSHHPPISAVYMYDDENGIRGHGYTRIGMTFSGAVEVRQTGHGMVHIDRYDEDYLVPLFSASVKGFLSGCLYPEISGTYHIVSTTGFVSELQFSGRGLLWGGQKNGFRAKVYRRDDLTKTPIYEMSGQWSDKFVINDAVTGEILETYDTNDPNNGAAPLALGTLEDQDPWESRKAWRYVLHALQNGHHGDVVTEKSKLEKAQRDMRVREANEGRTWNPRLFETMDEDYTLFDKLGSACKWKLHSSNTKGVWRVNIRKLEKLQKPFHENVTPLG